MNKYTLLLELNKLADESVKIVSSTVSFFIGDDVRIRYWLRDLQDRPFDTSGYTFTVDIGTVLTGEIPVAVNNVGGEWRFDLTAAQTLAIAAGTYKLVLKGTHTNSGDIVNITQQNALQFSVVT